MLVLLLVIVIEEQIVDYDYDHEQEMLDRVEKCVGSFDLDSLFVAQRFDGIEGGRPIGGI